MALNDENGGLNVSMPVAPAYAAPYGGGYNNGGGFGWGGDWSWIILLLLVCGGGWGGFGGFGGMGGFGGAMWDFPWLINGQQGINNNVSDGFRPHSSPTTSLLSVMAFPACPRSFVAVAATSRTACATASAA